MPNYKCKFNKKWLKLFQWVREVDDDIHKAYCKVCKSEIKIHVGGVTSLTQHKNTAKHKTKVMKKAALKQNSTGNSDNVRHVKTEKHQVTKTTEDILSGDDVQKDDSASNEEEAGEEEENEVESYWFDPDAAAAETDSTNSSLHSDQEQKHIPHLNHSVSAPKKSKSHPKTVHRNERKLSEQRMKMFEAELRVWQRKGEAIVKLMETVGHDKEMWEIINKQSRLHEKERDRIREEYDIM